MSFIMGPYLVVDHSKQPSHWLCWSMRKKEEKGGRIVHQVNKVYVANYEPRQSHCEWQERKLGDDAAYFYIYDDVLVKEDQQAYSCMILHQGAAYRIRSPKLTHLTQVERLDCHTGRYFFSPDPKATGLMPSPLPPLFNHAAIHHVLAFPTNLPPKGVPAPLISDAVIRTQHLDGFVEQLTAPRCFLLKHKPKRLKPGKLSIWLESGVYHYGWKINEYLLTGRINETDNALLLAFLETYHAREPVEKLHVVMGGDQARMLLSRLKASCLGLSLHQQTLIVARLSSDGLWPDLDLVTSPALLKTLLNKLIQIQDESELSPELESFCDDFHAFVAPEQLLNLEQAARFYVDTDPMKPIAERARVAHVYRFICLIVLTALHELQAHAQYFPQLMCTEDISARLIGEQYTTELRTAAQTMPREHILFLNAIDDQTPLTTYSYSDLESIEGVSRSVLNGDVAAAGISRLLLDDYLDENARNDALFKFLEDVCNAKKIIQSVAAWDEPKLLASIRAPEEHILYIIEQQRDAALLSGFFSRHAEALSRIIWRERQSHYRIFSQLNDESTQASWCNVTMEIEDLEGLVSFLGETSLRYLSHMLPKHCHDLSKFVNDVYDYQEIVEVLREKPALVDGVIPFLPELHQRIFKSRGVLDNFFHDIPHWKFEWGGMLTHDMKVALIPLCNFQRFLALFSPRAQRELLLIFQDQLFNFILTNQSVEDFLFSHPEVSAIVIPEFAKLSTRFYPQQFVGFSASTQALFITHCASKMEISCSDDFCAWMQQIHPENQTLMLQSAKNSGGLRRSIVTASDIVLMAHRVDESLHALFWRLISTEVSQVIQNIGALEEVYVNLSAVGQAKLAEILQGNGFVRRVSPRLNWDALNSSQRHQFFQLLFDLFWFKKQTQYQMDGMVISRASFFKNKLRTVSASLQWLQACLMSGDRAIDVPPSVLKSELETNPFLVNYTARVRAFCDGFAVLGPRQAVSRPERPFY